MNTPQKTNEIPIQIAGCELRRTRLRISDSTSISDWKQAGHLLCRAQGSIQWWIGDWINHGEAKWGDKYKEAISIFGKEAAREYGYELHQLQILASAARKCSIRTEHLSWTHHYIVAPMSPEDQERWLNEAVKNKWSVKELKAAIKAEYSDPLAGVCHETSFSWLTWVTQGERWLKFEIEGISEWETERVEAIKRDLDRIVPLKQLVDAEYDKRKALAA